MNVEVRVKPGSKKGPQVQLALDGSLLVFVREPAVEGKANSAVIELLAKHFDVPKSSLKILRGHSSRMKLIEVK